MASARPFHWTTEPAQFVPVTARMNEEPAVADNGTSAEIVGGGGLIVKVTPLEGVPPEFRAVMAAVPVVWIRDAGTEAVNCVAL